MSTSLIYGRHAVVAVLNTAPERVQRLYLASGAEKEFKPLAQKFSIRTEELSRAISKELEGEVHQGIVARVSMQGLLRNYAEFMNEIEPIASTCLVLLNEITDPHNVGAIIRSAAAFGAAGVLIPSHNQAPITGAVVKASAGMVFSVPIVQISNENQTILDLMKINSLRSLPQGQRGIE